MIQSTAIAMLIDDQELYVSWNQVLKSYVQDDRVDYASLKNNPTELKQFLDKAQSLSSDDFKTWQNERQIAFWINVYNASILQIVIREYPISGGFSLKGFAYPKNSIQQISNVWDLKTIQIFGNQISANDIEHEILRKQYDEPRIHFALVCASVGCPPIRKEAYTGLILEAQLEDQVNKFLSDPKKNFMSEEGIEISKIFKWFEDDFGGLTGVRDFIKKRKPGWNIHSSTNVDYLEYDWSLNEQ